METSGRRFNAFNKMVETVSNIAVSIGAFLVVIWVLVFVAYVVLRKLFNINFLFIEEYTSYWVVLVVFISMGYTFRKGEHIRVDTVTSRLSSKTRNILDIISVLGGLGVSCFLAKSGMDWVLSGIKQGSHYMGGMESLLWPTYLWIPIGYVLLSLELVVFLWIAISKVVKTRRIENTNRTEGRGV